MPENTRDKIIEAAAALFAARGFSAVSTKEIARKARVNEATLFRVVGGKRKLLAPLLELHNRHAMQPEQVESLMRIDNFDEAMRAYCDALVRNYSVYTVRLPMALAIEMKPRERDAWVDRYVRPRYVPVIQRIRSEQRAGRLKREVLAEAALGSLIMMLHGAGVASDFFGPRYRAIFGIRTPINARMRVDLWLAGMRASNRSHASK